MAAAPDRDRARPLRLDSVVLPVWMARGLAGLLIAGAMALPWIATWQGVLKPEAPVQPSKPKEVQLRPELVELPGGTFMMGSPNDEPNREDDEKQHPAEVGPFAICRTEVTLGQWEAVMGTRPNDCNWGCEDRHPVQRVSWEDAIRYMNRLTDRENVWLSEGKRRTRCYDEGNWTWDQTCTGYRLPTEAEWEYAARAGTTTAYSFGDDAKDLCKYGNGADQAGKQKYSNWTVNEACNDGYAEFAPVGSFEQNAWGLYDMHGNVWEWVWDEYGPYPERSTLGYAGPGGRDRRVLRGGAFYYEPKWLRSSVRGGYRPTVTVERLGFRCIRDAAPSN